MWPKKKKRKKTFVVVVVFCGIISYISRVRYDFEGGLRQLWRVPVQGPNKWRRNFYIHFFLTSIPPPSPPTTKVSEKYFPTLVVPRGRYFHVGRKWGRFLILGLGYKARRRFWKMTGGKVAAVTELPKINADHVCSLKAKQDNV